MAGYRLPLAQLAGALPPAGELRLRRIAKALFSGAAARIASSLLTLVSLPLAVRYLGAERYGVWATIATTAVWLNLLDLGIASTLTNHIARAAALGEHRAARRFTSNALAVTIGLCAMAGLAFAVIAGHVDWMKLLNVSSAVRRSEVTGTIGVAVGLVLVGIPANLGSKILAGYQELHRSNYVLSVGPFAGLIGLAVGIVLKVSMPVLLLLSAGCLTLTSLALLGWTLAVGKPWLFPSLSMLNWSIAKQLLHGGTWFFLIQIAGVVVFSSDNVIVSHYLGAAAVTPYNVCWRLVGAAAILQALLFQALWPAYADAFARQDFAWIRRTFSLVMTGTLALNLACFGFLVLAGRAVIRLWAGPAAVPDHLLLLAMGLWGVISGAMTMESCLLAALSRVREQALLSVAAAIVNLALSIALVRHLGSLGVIAGTILSYLLVLVVPQTLVVRSALREMTAQGEVVANATQPVETMAD